MPSCTPQNCFTAYPPPPASLVSGYNGHSPTSIPPALPLNYQPPPINEYRPPIGNIAPISGPPCPCPAPFAFDYRPPAPPDYGVNQLIYPPIPSPVEYSPITDGPGVPSLGDYTNLVSGPTNVPPASPLNYQPPLPQINEYRPPIVPPPSPPAPPPPPPPPSPINEYRPPIVNIPGAAPNFQFLPPAPCPYYSAPVPLPAYPAPLLIPGQTAYSPSCAFSSPPYSPFVLKSRKMKKNNLESTNKNASLAKI